MLHNYQNYSYSAPPQQNMYPHPHSIMVCQRSVAALDYGRRDNQGYGVFMEDQWSENCDSENPSIPFLNKYKLPPNSKNLLVPELFDAFKRLANEELSNASGCLNFLAQLETKSRHIAEVRCTWKNSMTDESDAPNYVATLSADPFNFVYASVAPSLLEARCIVAGKALVGIFGIHPSNVFFLQANDVLCGKVYDISAAFDMLIHFGNLQYCLQFFRPVRDKVQAQIFVYNASRYSLIQGPSCMSRAEARIECFNEASVKLFKVNLKTGVHCIKNLRHDPTEAMQLLDQLPGIPFFKDKEIDKLKAENERMEAQIANLERAKQETEVIQKQQDDNIKTLNNSVHSNALIIEKCNIVIEEQKQKIKHMEEQSINDKKALEDARREIAELKSASEDQVCVIDNLTQQIQASTEFLKEAHDRFM